MIYKKSAVGLIFIFMLLLLINPDVCKKGIMQGLLICGNIIIPSLFPFVMCVLFIFNSGLVNKLQRISPVTERLLGLDYYTFILFVMSTLGGYPIGAKLINEGVKNNNLQKDNADKILCFCVNAGPAFIISAVGVGVLNSKKLGVVLYISHLIGTLIIQRTVLLINRKSFKTIKPILSDGMSPTDNFVTSTTSAAQSILNICFFVILFSGINTYLIYYSHLFKPLKYLTYITEITNSLFLTKNIYLLSFLLGLGGVCIWFQIFSISKSFKINYFRFVFFRILHGILSTILTIIFVKALKISISSSVSVGSSTQLFYANPLLTASMIFTIIIFIISLTGNEYNDKIIKDLI